MKNKNCSFQYAYNKMSMFGYTGDVEIKEDTPLITLDEANILWEKYLPDFIKKLKLEENPEMAIWINMKNDTDYRETLAHVDSNTKTENGKLYIEKREYITLN